MVDGSGYRDDFQIGGEEVIRPWWK
jgi:hypothetical protein